MGANPGLPAMRGDRRIRGGVRPTSRTSSRCRTRASGCQNQKHSGCCRTSDRALSINSSSAGVGAGKSCITSGPSFMRRLYGGGAVIARTGCAAPTILSMPRTAALSQTSPATSHWWGERPREPARQQPRPTCGWCFAHSRATKNKNYSRAPQRSRAFTRRARKPVTPTFQSARPAASQPATRRLENRRYGHYPAAATRKPF